MDSRNNSQNEAIDQRLDALLSRREVKVSADFLARLHDQLASEDQVAAKAWAPENDATDKQLDQLLAKQQETVDSSFLKSIKQRLELESQRSIRNNRRITAFTLPRWAAAAAAVLILGLATWMQISREDRQISDTVASHSPIQNDLNLGNVQAYDPEITQILALAQNLDPNQELRSLDADRLQSFLLSSY